MKATSSKPAIPHSQFDIAESVWGSWKINGEDVDEETSEDLHESVGQGLEDVLDASCPYCAITLAKSEFEDRDWEDEDNTRLDKEYGVVRCPRCAYWKFYAYEGTRQCMDPSTVLIAQSVAARFEVLLPDGCAQEMAQELRRRPHLWHEIDPRKLEKLVAEIFRANYRHADVLHVGRPGDGGVDVLFIDDDSTRWLLQVKRRGRPGSTEGFSTLQSLLGTLTLEEERHGMVVSTADSFSSQARRTKIRAAGLGYTVELIDKGKLDRMLDPLIPERPWDGLLRHPAVADLSSEAMKLLVGGRHSAQQSQAPRSEVNDMQGDLFRPRDLP